MILKERLENPDELMGFSWEGFTYAEELSKPDHPVFLNGQG